MSDVFSKSPLSGAVKKMEADKRGGSAPDPQTQDSNNQVRSYVDRIVRLEEEKRETAKAIKDVYDEAKSAGFAPKAIRIVVKREMETADQRAAREAVEAEADLIIAALGAFVDSPLGQAAVARVQ